MSEMTPSSDILVVIPARGGSKGIPRKNLRSLAGKPLIAYAIATARASCFRPDVFVSSEDSEILTIARKLGADTIKRDPAKAQDATTLNPVIFDAYQQATGLTGKIYRIIVTVQPTSPLLTTESLDRGLAKILADPETDTVISVVNDTHLTWTQRDGRFVPNYGERVNRQYLPPVYKETGGFLITRDRIITEDNRIGPRVHLEELSPREAIDIDTFEDWNLCEYFLRHKRVVIVVKGYHEIGLGHVYNMLLLANDILDHEIIFLVERGSDLALERIRGEHYKVFEQNGRNLLDDLRELRPRVVINDRLNNDATYIRGIRGLGAKVVNFEDLGSGAAEADLVINAVYPETTVKQNHFSGADYFLLRDEFVLTEPREISRDVKTVLLTFGGVDPNNYTKKVLEAIRPFCRERGIGIEIVAGFGYRHYDSLEAAPGVRIFKNSRSISDHMSEADIIFASAGRTTYEIASLHVPTIVLSQNEREKLHFFASSVNGFLNLGLGTELSAEDLLSSFRQLVDSYETRLHMSKLMKKNDLRSGRRRVVELVRNLLKA